MRIFTIFKVSAHATRLVVSLFWIWITLGWNVRKARKAFEKELVLRGISKRQAKRLSQTLKAAKDQVMASIWKAASPR